jgi:hypothetical protein
MDQSSLPKTEELIAAKFKINMVQIDEEKSNKQDVSLSNSKESPLRRRTQTRNSSVYSPNTEDYVKEDVLMLENSLKKFEK